jgi:hypothetical protein
MSMLVHSVLIAWLVVPKLLPMALPRLGVSTRPIRLSIGIDSRSASKEALGPDVDVRADSVGNASMASKGSISLRMGFAPVTSAVVKVAG